MKKTKKMVKNRNAEEIMSDLVAEMYDKLAARMVVALYEEKQRILSRFKK